MLIPWRVALVFFGAFQVSWIEFQQVFFATFVDRRQRLEEAAMPGSSRLVQKQTWHDI